MADPLQITATISERTTQQDDGLIRYRVWVSSATNMPPEIFLIRTLPTSPESTHTPTSYARVCTYADLVNYSTAPDDYRRHYRVSSLDLLFTSLSEANEFASVLNNNFAHLTTDIQNTETATPVVTEENL